MKGWRGVSNVGRRTGKTTALVQACKWTDGVLVCHSADRARQVAKEHDIDTVSVHSGDGWRGFQRPFFFEAEAVDAIVTKYEEKLGDANERIKELEEELEKLREQVWSFARIG